jgi:ketopantoate reductase
LKKRSEVDQLSEKGSFWQQDASVADVRQEGLEMTQADGDAISIHTQNTETILCELYPHVNIVVVLV